MRPTAGLHEQVDGAFAEHARAYFVKAPMGSTTPPPAPGSVTGESLATPCRCIRGGSAAHSAGRMWVWENAGLGALRINRHFPEKPRRPAPLRGARTSSCLVHTDLFVAVFLQA